MAATSPYQGNDYQAVSNFRPYELPVNDIFKGIVAQNQFWDAGAARVKSVYDNALNLSLTTEENKNIRKQFMEDAEKQLTKLSTMDLSDPSVQRQGFGIFRPLLKDKGIIQDDYLTDQMGKIYSEAERYKKDEKTKGAGYNMDNLAYALRPFKGFGKNTSRDQLDGIFEKAKNAEYIPYYDVSKERKEILEMCKPDKASNTTSQGFYLETEKIASLTSQKLWGCLEAQLSGQARQQIRITGTVRYGDDYETLKKDYISAAESKSKYYTEQIKELSANKAPLIGKTDNVSIKLMKQIDEEISQYKKAKEGYDEDLVKYHTWDDKYMQDNYEDLAATAWMHREEGAFASAFARIDVEKDKKADAISMMFYTQQKLDDRQLKDFKHDEDMAQYNLKLKLLSGDTDADLPTRIRALKNMGVPNDQIYTWLGEAGKEKAPTSVIVENTISTANKNISKKISDIVTSSEIQGNPALATIVEGIKDEKAFTEQLPKLYKYVANALTIDPNDAKALSIKEGLNEYVKLTNTRTQWKSILDEAYSVVEKKTGTLKANFEALRADFAGRKIRDANGNYYNSNELFNILTGGDPNYTVTGDLNIIGGKDVTIIDNRTGKQLSFDDRDAPFGGKNSEDIVKNLFNSIKDKRNNFTSQVNDLLGQNAAVQKMMLSSGNLLGNGKIDTDKPTATLKQVQDIFGNAFPQYNTVGGFDPVDGWVNIQATDAKGKIVPASALRDAAAASPYGTSQIETGEYPNSIKIKLPYLTGVMDKPDYSETLKSLMTYAGNRVTSENLPGLILEVGITPNGNKVQINTTKSLGSGLAKYTILLNGTEIPVKIGSDLTSALKYASDLLADKVNVEIKQ